MPANPLYDLSLAENDFARRDGLPDRTVVLCSHPRSGSTLLGEAMHFSRGLGCPLEYLHRGFRPTLAERWQAPDLTSYVAAMHRWRTDPSGVFSTKLFWQDVEEIAYEYAPDRFPVPMTRTPDELSASDYRTYHAVLVEILPHPTYVYLHRRDLVRQAVSAVVATQTRMWRAIPGIGRAEAIADPEYDYDRILAMVSFARDSGDHWTGYFAANRIAPYEIAYEDLVRDYTRTVTELLIALGYPGAAPSQRMQRQSNAMGEAMVLRFLHEHAAREA